MPTQDSGKLEPAPGLYRALGEGSVVAGRYEIERLVARGGMATVFLARQLGLNRTVALKLVHPAEEDVEDRGAFVERFRLEAKTLASLSHPHIVTVFDYGETEEGDCFIAMEYVEGPRFARLLKQGPLETNRAVDLVIQVCRALRYAHTKGVIHRDVKLSNVLIGNDEHGEEHAKVVDFGLVKITGNEQKLTSHGLVLGSPHFMAPEQVRGGDIDHRADLYSVGILLYCSLTGRYPFHGASRTATMTAHLSREVPAFSELVPDRRFPPGLEAVVVQALSKEPEERQQDMDALISCLMPFASGPGDLPSMGLASPETLVQHAPEPASTRPRRWVLGVVGVASFALALAVLLGVWRTVRGPTGPVEHVDTTRDLPRALPAPPPLPPVEPAAEPTPEADPEPAVAPEPQRSSSRSGSGTKSARRSSGRSSASSGGATQPASEPRQQTVSTASEAPPAEPEGTAEPAAEAEPEPPSTRSPPATDLADPWEGGAEPAASSESEDDSSRSWEQAGGDLRDPWGD